MKPIEFGPWHDLTGMTIDQVAASIDTNINTFAEMRPVDEAIIACGQKTRKLDILDYGCGLGRNCLGIVKHSDKWSVYGYDSPQMLEYASEVVGEQKRIFLTGSWEKLKESMFDAVLCCLVLQHMEIGLVKTRLGEFARIAPRLVVYGKRQHDHGYNLWKLMGGMFKLEMSDYKFQIDGPGEEHSLVVYSMK